MNSALPWWQPDCCGEIEVLQFKTRRFIHPVALKWPANMANFCFVLAIMVEDATRQVAWHGQGEHVGMLQIDSK